ncbi:MAG: MFS family permease [Candidatus Azotimanducaceae bacterium]|jgi:MFS family permease
MLQCTVIISVWMVLSAILGIVGTGIGPGVIMFFYCIVFGLCGAAISSFVKIKNFKIPTRYTGIVISFVGTIVGLLVFPVSSASLLHSFGLLFLFFLIPSYGMYYLVEAATRKLTDRNDA